MYTRAVRSYNRDLGAAKDRIEAATREANNHNGALAWYYNHAMAYGFRFKITEKNGLAATASWKLPLIFNGNPGTLTLGTVGGGLGDNKERQSERKINLVVTFEDLHGLDCTDAPEEAGILRSLQYPIRGKIGVEEVIEQYFILLDRARDDQKNEGIEKFKTIFASTDAYTDTLTFTTTLSGSVSPSIVLNPTLREQFNGSLGFSASREDVHLVSISLKETTSGAADKDGDKITRVQIVPDDEFGLR